MTVGLAVYPQCDLFLCILEVVVMTIHSIFLPFFFFLLFYWGRNIEQTLFFSRWKIKQSVILSASVNEANKILFLFASLFLQVAVCLLVRWTDMEKLVKNTGEGKHKKSCIGFLFPKLVSLSMDILWHLSLYVPPAIR